MTDAPIAPGVRFDRLGALLQTATPPASMRRHLDGHVRLVASVERMRRRSRARAPMVALALVGAVAAAVVLILVRMRAGSPIAWHVENGAVGAQGYVSISAASPSARLVFDDGSNVTLDPGSRSRVARTTAVGAEVVLEQGRARVHVSHRDATQWLVDAGPFAVRVTGTDFSVAWAPDAETLDVWMRSGRVVIRGPVLGDALALSAGQHVRARLRDEKVEIDVAPESSSARGPRGAEPGLEPSANPAPGVDAIAATGPLSLPTTPVRTWSALVAAGDFARVVREAQAEDTGRALVSRPLADLRALGDAARYAGDTALADRAYVTVRARFPSSADSCTAAFLLGRVAEEQEHVSEKALRWYDAYLEEAPDGPFAGDALGRKMLITSKSRGAAPGADAARALAERYLRRFPSGPYGAAALDLAR
jgi:hypothetical protein